ncbi:hypothetical protein D3C72_1997740 [compost metagenome]
MLKLYSTKVPAGRNIYRNINSIFLKPQRGEIFFRIYIINMSLRWSFFSTENRIIYKYFIPLEFLHKENP